MTTDKALHLYTEMMIQRIDSLTTDWRKPWFTEGCTSEPRSIDGRRYHSMNAFLLYMFCEMKQYEHPVFVSFNRAHALGAHIRKGAQSVPVFFWMLRAKNVKTGDVVDIKDYDDMTTAEKSQYDLKPVLRCYNVFNIADTTIEEDCPDVWAKATQGDKPRREQDAEGMFVCTELDNLIDTQSWYCPINVTYSRDAFYSPQADAITIPEKKQYDVSDDKITCGMEYYSTLLHEMAHSTGASKRLNRIGRENNDRGREELVAELTSAVCGKNFGFSAHVQANSAAYIKCWLESIKQKPSYLISILSDVAKATDMINAAVKNANNEDITA